MISENLKQAFISLRQAKLRSFLTMLGIIIGVSSVVSVIAIGEGVKKSISGQVAEFGTDLLQVNPGRAFDDSENSEGGGFNPTASFGASTLTEADVQTIKDTPNVKLVAPFMIISGVIKSGEKIAETAFIMATTPEGREIFPEDVARGRFFNDQDSGVIVLGGNTAEKLFGSGKAIGQNITLRGKQFKVIGVFAKPKSGGLSLGPSMGDAVFMPFTDGKALNNNTANIIEIDLKATSTEKVDEVKQAVKKRLQENHGGEKDFTVATPQEQLNLFNNILNILTGFIAAIASIALLVGGIGIMNIMLVSVTERTREIGIRKAIGASNRHILLQFLIEAIVISIIGGFLGVFFAYLQGLAVKELADITPIIGMDAIILAVGVSTGVGVIFGLAPAIRAMRMRPIQALRHE